MTRPLSNKLKTDNYHFHSMQASCYHESYLAPNFGLLSECKFSCLFHYSACSFHFLYLQGVLGDHKLMFQFHHFSNPSDRDVNGRCCDIFCGSCDTLFHSLCLRNGGVSSSQAGQCISGTSHNPGQVGGKSITFGGSIGHLSNPFSYSRSGPVPQVLN